MDTQNNKKRVKPWQAVLMLVIAIAIVVVGLLVLKVNNRVVLLVDGVIMCTMAVCFGIKYSDIQTGIKETISSMLIAMLILLAVGVLVGTWLISGTVPFMIYYGMKLLTPGLFLPIVCIICTLMSCMVGTSWGTLATVGIACMGVAQGLGVPAGAAAGAICVGAFFGDKVSPLSDSPIMTTMVSDVPLLDGIKHSLISTVPAYIVSLVFLTVYGLRFKGAAIGGELYDEIIGSIEANFNLSPLLLIPVLVVIILIATKKPTLPTFVAAAALGSVAAMIFQKASLSDVLTAMYSGYVSNTGIATVDSMLTRGGFNSMMSTVALFIAAGIFGAPLRVAGVVDVLLDFIRRVAKTSRSMAMGVFLLHTVFFVVTGTYNVTYPVIGGMVKDLFPEYGLDRKNLVRILLDTGTGFAPLLPWSTTGAYTVATLGVSATAFAPFAPMLWLPLLITIFTILTGIGMAKLPAGVTTEASADDQ